MGSVFSRIYGGLASLKLTIVLLTVLAVVLIYGTFYESANGTPMAQRYVYASRWFDTILVLLAANMVACTAKRYPYKPHQLGFLMVHCGILTILTGAMLTRNFGRDGELFLFEGETGQAITSTRPSLRVDVPSEGVAGFLIPVVFPAREQGSEVDREVRLPHGSTRLRLLRYFPNAQWTSTVAEGDTLNPAVHVSWTQHDVPGSTWLVPADAERRKTDVPFRIESFAAASDRQADSLLAAVGGARPQSRGTLRLRIGGQTLADIPIDGAVPRRVHAGDYDIVLRQWFSHFVLRDGKPANASPDMINPALLFDVTGPGGGTENHVVFALHEMGSLLSSSGDHGLGIDADYVYDGPSATESRMTLVHAPGSGWRAASSFDIGLPPDGRIEIGHTYASPAAHVEFAVDQALDRAAIRDVLVNVDRQERNPAVLVQAVAGDASSEPQWVVSGDERTLRLGDRDVSLQFVRREYPLGFSVQLVDFAETTYPGTSRSATYASDVLVSDGGAPVPIHISMNKPLKHKGFRLFQSSYLRSGGQEASVFSVSYDPGVNVVYTGFIIFIAGMVAIFYLKPVIRKAYLRSAAPQPVIPRNAVLERT